MTKEKPDSLCWLTFLNARATAIDWLLAEFKYTDEQIATYLSMDPVQVRLIRERDRRLDVQSPEPGDEPDEFMCFLDEWAKAYPLDVFPLPDFRRVAEVLKAAGLSLDQVSAANFRHVINRTREKYAENRT